MSLLGLLLFRHRSVSVTSPTGYSPSPALLLSACGEISRILSIICSIYLFVHRLYTDSPELCPSYLDLQWFWLLVEKHSDSCLFNSRYWWSPRGLRLCRGPVRITRCSPPSPSLPSQTPRRPRPHMYQRLGQNILFWSFLCLPCSAQLVHSV